MPLARGAAIIGPAGEIGAADPGFAALLGLDASSPAADLERHAAAEPALGRFLEGAGPGRLERIGPGGAQVLERYPAPAGWLVVARDPRDDLGLEQAQCSAWVARLAGGLAHDVKNALNAVVLKLALLREIIQPDAATGRAGAHLTGLHDQVERIDGALRRFVDVVDPPAALGRIDVAQLLADLVGLFAYEARLRRIALSIDGSPGALPVSVEVGRVMRLLVGLFGSTLARTRTEGALAVSAQEREGWVEVVFRYTAAPPDPDLAYERLVAAGVARSLGGALEVGRHDGDERVALRLPGGGRR
jgi:signal transduction histidine kinase